MQQTIVLLTTEDQAKLGIGKNDNEALVNFIGKNSSWLRVQGFVNDGDGDDDSNGSQCTFLKQLDLIGWRLTVIPVAGEPPVAEIESDDEFDMSIEEGEVVSLDTSELAGVI